MFVLDFSRISFIIMWELDRVANDSRIISPSLSLVSKQLSDSKSVALLFLLKFAILTGSLVEKQVLIPANLCLSSDKSNLLVCRNNQGAEVQASPSLHKHISQMVFHKIRKEDLVIVSDPLF